MAREIERDLVAIVRDAYRRDQAMRRLEGALQRLEREERHAAGERNRPQDVAASNAKDADGRGM